MDSHGRHNLFGVIVSCGLGCILGGGLLIDSVLIVVLQMIEYILCQLRYKSDNNRIDTVLDGS